MTQAAISPAAASAEILRRKRMRESLVAFAENIQIPGAPLVDEGDNVFELFDGTHTTLNTIDSLSMEIEDWSRKKEIARSVHKEYGGVFAPVGSSLALHHRILLEKIQVCMETKYGRLMVFMPPGSAKALALDTPIFTPTGWRTILELCVGDKVFDENGCPCKVIRKTGIFRKRQCYRILADCGDHIIADEDHNWKLSGGEIVTTKELAKRKSAVIDRPMRGDVVKIGIDPCGRFNTMCIEVDSPSHLFLAGRSMTPTHNSTYCTVLAPIWAMGVSPGLQVILASYATPIAKKLGSKGRFVVEQEAYGGAFRDKNNKPVKLLRSTQAKEMWAMTNGSEYMSGGLLSGMTGNRAGGVVIDDPVKGRRAADSKNERETTLAAFEDDLTTRLIPGAWQILVQCLVGDTGILLTDGSEKLIRDIEIGDCVMSWRNGELEEAKVTNFANKGLDNIFTIKTSCGRIVSANERHPFLVENNGKFEWVRLKNLKIGDKLVAPSKVAMNHLKSKRKGFAGHTMTSNAFRLNKKIGYPEIGDTIGESPARQMVAMNHVIAGDYVSPVIQRSIGKKEKVGARRSRIERRILGIATELHLKTMIVCLKIRTACVRFVKIPQRNLIKLATSTGLTLTTATTLKKSGACFVTSATLDLVIFGLKNFFSKRSNTCVVEASKIVSIEKSDIENVYDIEVTPNENFIANGFVSHNTRWSAEDLAGSILPADYDGESGPIMCRDGLVWEVLNIPGKAEHADDPLGRKVGEYLWPEWFDEKFWKMYEPRPGDVNSPSERRWSALFQQRPRPDSGNMFEEEWFNRYPIGKHPKNLNMYEASDWATKEDEGDFTEHGVFGLDPNGHLIFTDWFYGQEDTAVGIDELLKLVKKWGIKIGFGESGIIRHAIEPAFKRRQREKDVRLLIKYLPNAGKKTTKALSFQSLAKNGKVWIPDCPWGDRLIEQLCDFPSSSHDDGVDVCGLAGRALDDLVWSRHKVPKEDDHGPRFGSWDWLTYEYGPKKRKQDRVF